MQQIKQQIQQQLDKLFLIKQSARPKAVMLVAASAVILLGLIVSLVLINTNLDLRQQASGVTYNNRTCTTNADCGGSPYICVATPYGRFCKDEADVSDTFEGKVNEQGEAGCGNGICGMGESVASCPADCSLGTGQAGANCQTDRDCAYGHACVNNSTGNGMHCQANNNQQIGQTCSPPTQTCAPGLACSNYVCTELPSFDKPPQQQYLLCREKLAREQIAPADADERYGCLENGELFDFSICGCRPYLNPDGSRNEDVITSPGTNTVFLDSYNFCVVTENNVCRVVNSNPLNCKNLRGTSAVTKQEADQICARVNSANAPGQTAPPTTTSDVPSCIQVTVSNDCQPEAYGTGFQQNCRYTGSSQDVFVGTIDTMTYLQQQCYNRRNEMRNAVVSQSNSQAYCYYYSITTNSEGNYVCSPNDTGPTTLSVEECESGTDYTVPVTNSQLYSGTSAPAAFDSCERARNTLLQTGQVVRPCYTWAIVNGVCEYQGNTPTTQSQCVKSTLTSFSRQSDSEANIACNQRLTSVSANVTVTTTQPQVQETTSTTPPANENLLVQISRTITSGLRRLFRLN